MGLFKDLVSVAGKVADTVDDVAKANGIKGVVGGVKDYADDTMDEIKDAISGDKGEEE